MSSYNQRYDETQSLREKYNKLLMKLKQKKEKEIKLLKKCCGIIKLKRWIQRNIELMINPNLHQNACSWLFRWLIIYIIVLSICLPFILPVLQKIFYSDNNHHHKSSTFNLYFVEEIFKYLGSNTITKASSIRFGPILGSIMNILQFFGVIGSSTNTEYLPDNYHMIPIDNIYTQISNELFYDHDQLFINWKNGDLKYFFRINNIDNTCFEKQCYTDTIIKYLKESEMNKLLNTNNNKLPIAVLREYLNHYNITYDECYNTFWSKDYQCFAEKAAKIKILNDIYYRKKYLLSFKGKQSHHHHHIKKVKDDTRNRNENEYKSSQQKHKHKSQHFGFQDMGSFAFDLFSGY